MSSQVADQVMTKSDRTVLGFWIYLMTDVILFATLFAVYAVLKNNTFGGPAGKDIFSMPYVLIETLVLLTSSFLCGLSVLAARTGRNNQAQIWLGLTFLLGMIFILMEIGEFHSLVLDGNSWQRSGFLSAFFTLVGTHGVHIIAGLIWLAVLRAQMSIQGFTPTVVRRLTLFSLFWHFLDVVWIFIFTIVYLMGAAL